MSIVLIGFPGSGKTTLARQLGKHLEIDVVDTDVALIKTYNQTHKKKVSDCASIYKNLGEKGFRRLELKILQSLQIEKNLIIATGGGTPVHSFCRIQIKQMGFVVNLISSKELLYDRLKARQTAPPYLPAAALRNSFHKLYFHRIPIYRAIADLGIDPMNETAIETITTQYKIWSKNRGKQFIR